MIGDLLLAWLSETGSGTISDLRSRAAWLARTENLDLHESATGRWLRDIASLGHCEVDWARGKWSAAPPVITRLPLADGLAILVGARRNVLVQELNHRGLYVEQASRPGSARDIPAPRTILMPFQRTRDLEEAAAAIGVSYVGCAAASIARLLKPRSSMAPAAPPAFDSPLEQLSAFSPQTWRAVPARDPDLPDGLYREQIHRRWVHLMRRAGRWYSTELSSGLFAELSRRGETVIRWRRDDVRRPNSGTFIVDWGAPLAPLQSRALVLCCGFIPRFGEIAATALYDNVPREIGVRVATSLGQTMQISGQ